MLNIEFRPRLQLLGSLLCEPRHQVKLRVFFMRCILGEHRSNTIIYHLLFFRFFIVSIITAVYSL